MKHPQFYFFVAVLALSGGCRPQYVDDANRLDSLLDRPETFDNAEFESLRMTNNIAEKDTRTLTSLFSATNRVLADDTGKAQSLGVLSLNRGTNPVVRLYLYEGDVWEYKRYSFTVKVLPYPYRQFIYER